ncbi:hypothetical protein [Halorubrum sp. DTA46]|uniref:hypothetical protein n=1 Tax=Halorubrum sp. DTA46 TaxID=3402162 RepID=UPI003AADFBC0
MIIETALVDTADQRERYVGVSSPTCWTAPSGPPNSSDAVRASTAFHDPTA